MFRQSDRQLLRELNRKVDLLMTAQQDLDALATDINNRVAELSAATDAIKAEVAKLQGQGVDVTGIQAAVAALDPVADGVKALAPTS